MVTPQSADNLFDKLKVFNGKRGYFLNPDTEFTSSLLESLIVNEERYGYQACPCRLAIGERVDDLDIICPCNYRDADLTDYGACYCGLYVNKPIFEGRQALRPIPERRPNKETRQNMNEANSKIEIRNSKFTGNSLPVWRCTVCGYLCAREDAPEICPICGVAHDRFERFN